MKKQTIVIATLLSSAMAMPAMAADWFIGGGIGAQQNKYEGSRMHEVDPGFNAEYAKDKETNVLYELRFGAYIDDNNRVYSTYSYNSDDHSRQQSLLLSYDYLVGLTADNKLNWFIGATAGVNHISPATNNVDSKNSFVWGGQTGLMYKFNDNVSTEIGYRYLKQDYDASVSYGNPEPAPHNIGITEAASLNDSQQLYLSVDYRF